MLLEIIWQPDPVALQLGPFSIRWYGLMYSFALIANYFLGWHYFKKANLPMHKLLSLCLMLFIAGLIGARLGQVFFYEWDYFSQYPSDILKIWKGGMASHGAFILMILSWWVYSKINTGFSFWWGMDRLAIMGALTVFFMRIGNFMNGEIVGTESQLPWSIVFGNYDHIPRHPIVLYEALVYLLVFIFLFRLSNSKRKLKYGLICSLFLIILVGSRIVLEQFKQDAGYTQLLSIPLVIAGILIGMWSFKGKLN